MRKSFMPGLVFQLIVGTTLMSWCGSRLQRLVNTDWEVAGFAVGILIVSASFIWPVGAAIAELRREIASLKKGALEGSTQPGPAP